MALTLTILSAEYTAIPHHCSSLLLQIPWQTCHQTPLHPQSLYCRWNITNQYRTRHSLYKHKLPNRLSCTRIYTQKGLISRRLSWPSPLLQLSLLAVLRTAYKFIAKICFISKNLDFQQPAPLSLSTATRWCFLITGPHVHLWYIQKAIQ